MFVVLSGFVGLTDLEAEEAEEEPDPMFTGFFLVVQRQPLG